MKKKDVAIDYRSLLISTVKERYFSFTLGALVVLLLTSIGFSLALPTIKSQFNKISTEEKVQLKGKETLKKEQARIYVVKEGDQLFLIAEKLYGSGQNMQVIMKANNISNPDLIEVGQKLIIPDSKSR